MTTEGFDYSVTQPPRDTAPLHPRMVGFEEGPYQQVEHDAQRPSSALLHRTSRQRARPLPPRRPHRQMRATLGVANVRQTWGNCTNAERPASQAQRGHSALKQQCRLERRQVVPPWWRRLTWEGSPVRQRAAERHRCHKRVTGCDKGYSQCVTSQTQ